MEQHKQVCPKRKNEEEEWTHMVRWIRNYKWSDKTTMEAWEDLEKLRLHIEKLIMIEEAVPVEGGANQAQANEARTRKVPCPKIRAFTDKLLLKQFMDQGKIEKKFDRAEVMKIEEKLKEKNYDWEEAKKAVRENKIMNEREKTNETLYGEWRSRKPEKKDGKSYQSKGGDRNGSFRENRNGSFRGNRNGSYNGSKTRTSTPDKWRKSSPSPINRNTSRDN